MIEHVFFTNTTSTPSGQKLYFSLEQGFAGQDGGFGGLTPAKADNTALRSMLPKIKCYILVGWTTSSPPSQKLHFWHEAGTGQDKAEDAGGLTPTKDNNEVMACTSPRANARFWLGGLLGFV